MKTFLGLFCAGSMTSYEGNSRTKMEMRNFEVISLKS
jgi:hypothetical protein